MWIIIAFSLISTLVFCQWLIFLYELNLFYVTVSPTRTGWTACEGQFWFNINRLLSFRIIITNTSAGTLSQGQINFPPRWIAFHQHLKLIDLLLRMCKGVEQLGKKSPLHFALSEDSGSDGVSSRAGDGQRSIKTWPRSTVDTCLVIARGLHGHAICFQMQNCTLRDYGDTPRIHITI